MSSQVDSCSRRLHLSELDATGLIDPLRQIILDFLCDVVVAEERIVEVDGYLHIGFRNDIKVGPGPLYLAGPLIVNEQKDKVILVDTRTCEAVAVVGRFQRTPRQSPTHGCQTILYDEPILLKPSDTGHIPHGFVYISDDEIYFIIDHEVVQMDLRGTQFYRIAIFYDKPMKMQAVEESTENRSELMALVSFGPSAEGYTLITPRTTDSFWRAGYVRIAELEHETLVHHWVTWGGAPSTQTFRVSNMGFARVGWGLCHNFSVIQDADLRSVKCSELLATNRRTPNFACVFKRPKDAGLYLCIRHVSGDQGVWDWTIHDTGLKYKKNATVTVLPRKWDCLVLVDGVVRAKVCPSGPRC